MPKKKIYEKVHEVPQPEPEPFEPAKYRTFTQAQRWAMLGGPYTGPFVHEFEINNAEYEEGWEDIKYLFGGNIALTNPNLKEKEAEALQRQRILSELGIEVKFYVSTDNSGQVEDETPLPVPGCGEGSPHWPKAK